MNNYTEILNYLDPALLSYEEWLKIGQALHYEGEVVCEVCKDEICTDYDAVFKYLDYLCDIDFIEEILTPDEVFDAVVGYMRNETEAGNKSICERLKNYCISDLNNYAEFYTKGVE